MRSVSHQIVFVINLNQYYVPFVHHSAVMNLEPMFLKRNYYPFEHKNHFDSFDCQQFIPPMPDAVGKRYLNIFNSPHHVNCQHSSSLNASSCRCWIFWMAMSKRSSSIRGDHIRISRSVEEVTSC